eukprot:TRINITY_DN24200_c0_g1_i1.p1 TRINITY_DN24200_c0_g1~~TRINITY_DN24200_c0_g1_i1.p1  ORF type:complete len:445 (-),score=58.61 TRINITY_DN24200_c0_g1_i1:856-2190(-)
MSPLLYLVGLLGLLSPAECWSLVFAGIYNHSSSSMTFPIISVPDLNNASIVSWVGEPDVFIAYSVCVSSGLPAGTTNAFSACASSSGSYPVGADSEFKLPSGPLGWVTLTITDGRKNVPYNITITGTACAENTWWNSTTFDNGAYSSCQAGPPLPTRGTPLGNRTAVPFSVPAPPMAGAGPLFVQVRLSRPVTPSAHVRLYGAYGAPVYTGPRIGLMYAPHTDVLFGSDIATAIIDAPRGLPDNASEPYFFEVANFNDTEPGLEIVEVTTNFTDCRNASGHGPGCRAVAPLVVPFHAGGNSIDLPGDWCADASWCYFVLVLNAGQELEMSANVTATVYGKLLNIPTADDADTMTVVGPTSPYSFGAAPTARYVYVGVPVESPVVLRFVVGEDRPKGPSSGMPSTSIAAIVVCCILLVAAVVVVVVVLVGRRRRSAYTNVRQGSV